MKQSASVCRIMFLGGFLIVTSANAADPIAATVDWFTHKEERAWLEPYDPTLLSRRVSSELSYESYDEDTSFTKLETTVRWAFPVHPDLAFGLQAMVPVKWGDTATSNELGIGDLEFRTGLVGRITPTLRFGAGVNAAFDTATDSILGDHAFQLRPILALRWDVHARFSSGVDVEYTFSPFEEGSHDVSALELKFPLIFKLSDRFSASMVYKPRWDLLKETDRNRLEFSATRLLGDQNQYAFTGGIEVPLSSESYDFKLYVGVARSF